MTYAKFRKSLYICRKKQLIPFIKNCSYENETFLKLLADLESDFRLFGHSIWFRPAKCKLKPYPANLWRRC